MSEHDVPAGRGRDELREKLRHLTRDPGPLGSAVCALLKAAEAELPVMVMPYESRAILDLLAPQEAREPEVLTVEKPMTLTYPCGCVATYRLSETVRFCGANEHSPNALRGDAFVLLGAPTPAQGGGQP